MNIKARQEIERQVVTQLLTVAKAAGWLCTSVYDGEEQVLCTTIEEAVDTVFSVDESWIHFRKNEVWKACALIVLGNDGWDCIADNSTGEPFNKEVIEVMDKYTEDLCTAHGL